MERKPYMNPYYAGIALGLVLLMAIVISGRGLGASGAIMRTVVAAEKVVVQEHVDNNFYLAKYGKGDKNPLNNWLVFEIIGVMLGGLFSGLAAGRFKKETNRGPRISDKQRWAFAVLGVFFLDMEHALPGDVQVVLP